MRLIYTKPLKNVQEFFDYIFEDMEGFISGFFGFPPLKVKEEKIEKSTDGYDGDASSKKMYHSSVSEYQPKTEVRENEYLIKAEVPGFEETEIKIEVKNNLLVIKAEQFKEVKNKKETQRSSNERLYFWDILEDVDQTAITAEYQNGLLTVTLPKKKIEKLKVKSIPIKISK